MKYLLAAIAVLLALSTAIPEDNTVTLRRDMRNATGGLLRQRQVIVQPRQRVVIQQRRFVQPRVQRFVIQQPQQLRFAQPIYTQPLVIPRQQILIIQ